MISNPKPTLVIATTLVFAAIGVARADYEYDGALAAMMVKGVDDQPVCDLSDLPCSQDGNKCNIKFNNESGKAGGSGGGSDHNQLSSSGDVSITARDASGNKVGNSLRFGDGQSKSLNLSKDAKASFKTIKVKINSTGLDKFTSPKYATLICSQVREVLKGRAVCNVFAAVRYGAAGVNAWHYTAYSCNGGKVKSLKPDKLSQGS
ncbi:MAG: hypothetical protein GC201_00195 [Alphaproteobacteria bacterium]|nr:hypothetical protein [Alphaproteobacteria bacterium]